MHTLVVGNLLKLYFFKTPYRFHIDKQNITLFVWQIRKSIMNNHREFCTEASTIFWEIADFVLVLFSAAPCIRLSVNRRSSLDWRKPGCRRPRLICWMSCMLLKLKWDSRATDTDTRADQAAIQCPDAHQLRRVVRLFLRQDECLVWRRDVNRRSVRNLYCLVIVAVWLSGRRPSSVSLTSLPSLSRLCQCPSVPYSSVSVGICRRQCTSIVRVCWFDRCTFTVHCWVPPAQ